MKRFILKSVFSCMLAFASSQLFAQTRFAQGVGVPFDLVDYDWYLDTLNRQLWQFKEKQWKGCYLPEVDTVLFCNELVILHSPRGYGVLNIESQVRWEFPIIHCADSLLLCGGGAQGLSFISSVDGELRSDHKLGYWCWMENQPPDTIDGQLAYCVVPYRLEWQSRACSEIHAFGMIGFNGHWLVEPKFDIPFHFEHGFADVLYYGQRKRINEKGEFVE